MDNFGQGNIRLDIPVEYAIGVGNARTNTMKWSREIDGLILCIRYEQCPAEPFA